MQPGFEEQQVESVDTFFNVDSAKLTEDAGAKLKVLATWVRCTPRSAIILEGHADPSGPKDYNVALSAERAAAVRAKLVAMGVPSDQIVIAAYGENGAQRPTYKEDRRVTAKAVTRPIAPKDFAG